MNELNGFYTLLVFYIKEWIFTNFVSNLWVIKKGFHIPQAYKFREVNVKYETIPTAAPFFHIPSSADVKDAASYDNSK